jgi:ABC-type multidrug transport system ATPase subunit
VRGISGGEARRVSVAAQLVTDPALLYCDEPSTGLDAFTTRNLCETFAAVAARGRTVVCTLHQPRADVLGLFHATLLLSKGRALFFGPTAAMAPHFAALGFICPVQTNPGDFFLDVSSVDVRSPDAEAATRAQVVRLVAAWETRVRSGGADDGEAGSSAAAETSPSACASSASASAAAAAAASALLLASDAPRSGGASALEQTTVLFTRGILNTARDAMTLAGLLSESVLIAVAIGAIFYNLGASPGALISRTSLCYLVGSLQTYQFMVFSIYCLVAEMAVFDHESADGMYGIVPFVAARYAVLLPQMLTFPTLFSIIVYYMTALRPEAAAVGVFIAVMFAVHMLGFSLALLCVSAQRSFAQASLMANSIYTFFGLVSGLLVQLDSVPIWLAWIKRISFLNFSFRILAVNELHGRVWPCPEGMHAEACAAYDGDATLARLGVHPDGVGDAAIALVVNFFVLLIVATAVLAARPRAAARITAAFAPTGAPETQAEAEAEAQAEGAPAEAGAEGKGGAQPLDADASKDAGAHANGACANGGAAATAAGDADAAAAAAAGPASSSAAAADASVVVPMCGASQELSFRAFAPVTIELQNVGLTLQRRRHAWLPFSGATPQSSSDGIALSGAAAASASAAAAAPQVILAGIRLTLRPGQLTGVMGASGSGKSSLLNALAARIRPGEGAVSGAVLFNGAPLRPAAARAVVGYVTQHDALLPLLTVFETLHYAARLRLPEARVTVRAHRVCNCSRALSLTSLCVRRTCRRRRSCTGWTPSSRSWASRRVQPRSLCLFARRGGSSRAAPRASVALPDSFARCCFRAPLAGLRANDDRRGRGRRGGGRRVRRRRRVRRLRPQPRRQRRRGAPRLHRRADAHRPRGAPPRRAHLRPRCLHSLQHRHNAGAAG